MFGAHSSEGIAKPVENYQKGKTVVEELTKESIPIPNIPENFTWMQVGGASKIRNLMSVAVKGFKEHGAVVWSGTGRAISKAITCAEILKRKNKAHQITKICYRKTEEFWDPLLTDLDQLVVDREEPVIHILLSRDLLDVNEPGYQAPGINRQNYPKESRNYSQYQSSSGHHKKNTPRRNFERFKPFKTQNGQKQSHNPEPSTQA